MSNPRSLLVLLIAIAWVAVAVGQGFPIPAKQISVGKNHFVPLVAQAQTKNRGLPPKNERIAKGTLTCAGKPHKGFILKHAEILDNRRLKPCRLHWTTLFTIT